MNTRPMPIADSLTEPFWVALRNGELRIQRCSRCHRYYHPPEVFCIRCLSTNLEFVPVSGRGRIRAYSQTFAGARQAYFREAAGYIVASVELEEQEDLIMYTNLVATSLSGLMVGAPVQVYFESLGDDTTIPLFRLAE